MYDIAIKNILKKHLINTENKSYKAFPINLSRRQVEEFHDYAERLGIIDVQTSIRTHSGIYFLLGHHRGYAEDFLANELYNTIEQQENPIAKIMIESQSHTGLIHTKHLNQDAKMFILQRKCKVDTSNMLDFYEFNSKTKENYAHECAFAKDLDDSKKLLALAKMNGYIKNLIQPMDQLVATLS